MHELLRGIVAQTSKQDIEFLKQFEPDLFWQQYGKKILIGLAAILVLGLFVYYRQRQAAEQEETAAAQLASAQDPATLQRLAQEYRGRPIGAQALLQLAQLEARAGRYPEAAEAFKSFLAQYPSHPMTDTAELGLAAIQEAQGDFQGAKTQYEQIARNRPGSYTAIAAKLGYARCCEALGLTKEALQAYEELRPQVRGSAWETEVNLRWMVLSRSQPSAAAPSESAEVKPVTAPPEPVSAGRP
jgi:TolA-binding protein